MRYRVIDYLTGSELSGAVCLPSGRVVNMKTGKDAPLARIELLSPYKDKHGDELADGDLCRGRFPTPFGNVLIDGAWRAAWAFEPQLKDPGAIVWAHCTLYGTNDLERIR